MNFIYRGPLGASKSLMNRVLILQSYFPDLKLQGDSDCSDVKDLQRCLELIGKTNDFEVHDGGTTFRFLVLRLSREPGEYKIKASPRLLERPQEELLDILSQLGVHAEKQPWGFFIRSHGWQKPKSNLKINTSRSSQFLSSVVLNSAKLPFVLPIDIDGRLVSEEYFKMTLAVTEELGLRFEKRNDTLYLFSWENLTRSSYNVGADLSSAFSLACFAAVSGSLELTNVYNTHLQPDYRFLSVLTQMNSVCRDLGEKIKVSKSPELRGIEVDLNNSPDLFPMLACLCAHANGRSILSGASQLQFKESNRLQKIFELFDLAQIVYKKLPDGIEIQGGAKPHNVSFEFSPDLDHRMAMAAAFLKFLGWKITIKDPNVVQKSFPEFWDITGVNP